MKDCPTHPSILIRKLSIDTHGALRGGGGAGRVDENVRDDHADDDERSDCNDAAHGSSFYCAVAGSPGTLAVPLFGLTVTVPGGPADVATAVALAVSVDDPPPPMALAAALALVLDCS